MSIFLKPACSCSRNDQCCQLWIILHDWLLVTTKMDINNRTRLKIGFSLLNKQLKTLNSFIKWRGSFTENFYQKKKFFSLSRFPVGIPRLCVTTKRGSLFLKKKYQKKKKTVQKAKKFLTKFTVHAISFGGSRTTMICKKKKTCVHLAY